VPVEEPPAAPEEPEPVVPLPVAPVPLVVPERLPLVAAPDLPVSAPIAPERLDCVPCAIPSSCLVWASSLPVAFKFFDC
jgi:hypothetical protein